MRAILCLQPGDEPIAPGAAPIVGWPPAVLAACQAQTTRVEVAVGGILYCDLSSGDGWPAAEAAARDLLAAAQAAFLVAGGLAGGCFPAACAADRAAPGILAVFAPGTEAAALAPLPITELPGLPPPLLHELRRLRLLRLGDVAALPAPLFAAIFGPAHLRWHALARGEDPRPVPEAPLGTRPLVARRTFPTAPTAVGEVRAVLTLLAGDLASASAAAGRAVTELTVTVGVLGGPPLEKADRPGTPLREATALEALAWPLLVRVLGLQRRRPVWLQLAATRTCEAVYQPALPPPPDPPDPHARLREAIAEIQQRFGPHTIQQGVPSGSRYVLRPPTHA